MGQSRQIDCRQGTHGVWVDRAIVAFTWRLGFNYTTVINDAMYDHQNLVKLGLRR